MPDQTSKSQAAPGKRRLGKTLVIVVAVVVLLAVIVALILPGYGDYTPRAKVSEVILGTSEARQGISMFYDAHKRLPRDAAEANLTLTPLGKIRNLTYDGSRGEIRAEIQDIPEVNGKSLIFKAELRDGRLNWLCLNDGIPAKHLAGKCRPD